MAIAQTDGSTIRKPLRLWPGVVLAVLQCLSWFVVPIVLPDYAVFGVLGTFIGGLAIIVWWAFFSRAPRFERWGAVVLMIVALVATWPIIHVSVAGAGMGMLFGLLATPVMSFVFVIGVVASHRLPERPRRAAMVATILLASGAWALVRIGGIGAAGDLDFRWRWSKTPEERLVAQAGDEPTAIPSAPPATETGADWPGFRGPNRDSIIPGVQIETNWSASPPVELWRRPIGPAWSSFAVHGGLLYTQEQRADQEIVACYNVNTGEPVWRHHDATRFWEANAGPGPRGTPTLNKSRAYTFGATGIVNALDAATGAVVWSRNAASDTSTKVPYWGFSRSPLVVEDMVIIAAAGQLVAYDIATGNPRWLGTKGGPSYSSPHLMKIDGVAQIVQMSKAGATSVSPADGKLLWQHPWPGFSIVQPALTADCDVLIGAGDGIGMSRLAVAHGPNGWTAEERWTSVGLKPYFNDFVVHNGHAFGFDGSILACIDLADGKRKWKGGRYGNGQLVLLADQDLLLVLSEQGELALVGATPDQFTELARFPAIQGKTWNHPALAGDVLLVRNDQEMAAFRLSLARR